LQKVGENAPGVEMIGIAVNTLPWYNIGRVGEAFAIRVAKSWRVE